MLDWKIHFGKPFSVSCNVLLLYFKRWYQVSHVISWDIRRADISSDRLLANLGHLDGHNTWNTWYLEKLNKSYDLKSLTVDVYDKYPELLLWQSALFQPMTARVISEIYYLSQRLGSCYIWKRSNNLLRLHLGIPGFSTKAGYFLTTVKRVTPLTWSPPPP